MGQTGPAVKPLRLVFMGTPGLAAAVLRHVLAWPGGGVVAVYCQPDRPAGRGMSLKEPPVKLLAKERGIPVQQPPHFKSPEAVETLRAYDPDYLLVAAYGLILPQKVLDIPRKAPLNVHTSLLPAYRGAAPIQRAVMNGDDRTGVTVMRMDAGMDTGPVVLRKTVPIGARTTAGELHDMLAEEGGALLLQALEGLEAGMLAPIPQDHARATHAAKLDKADGYVDFSRPAAAVDARVRGVTPWPGATAILERDGEAPLPVTICAGRPLPRQAGDAAPPGVLLAGPPVDGHIAVACGDGGLYGIASIRPAGKKAMDAASFFHGYLNGRPAARLAMPQTATGATESA